MKRYMVFAWDGVGFVPFHPFMMYESVEGAIRAESKKWDQGTVLKVIDLQRAVELALVETFEVSGDEV